MSCSPERDASEWSRIRMNRFTGSARRSSRTVPSAVPFEHQQERSHVPTDNRPRRRGRHRRGHCHDPGRVRRRGRRRRQQFQAPSDTVTVALDADAAPDRLRPAALLAGPVPVLQRACTTRCSSPTAEGGRRAQPGHRVLEQRRQHSRLTLTLKDGVTFTDGSTLDADAGQGQPRPPQRHRPAEANGALGAGGRQEITDVTAPDPQTVVITWAAPQAQPAEHLADTAGVIVGADGRRGPRLAGDHAGRLRRRTR